MTTENFKQLLLFEESLEKRVEREIEKIHTRTENVRKGIYKRHSELYGMLKDLQSDLEIIKKNICK